MALTNRCHSRCRKQTQFGPQDCRLVNELLLQDWSLEQISGHLRFWKKKCRKLYRRVDSRGRLQGKHMNNRHPDRIETMTADTGAEFHGDISPAQLFLAIYPVLHFQVEPTPRSWWGACLRAWSHRTCAAPAR